MKYDKVVNNRYVAGPEEGHIMIDDKFYIVDFITDTPCKEGDYIRDKWGYTYVEKIIDVTEKGYILFWGYEIKTAEFRERIINEILGESVPIGGGVNVHHSPK